ncbi:hypothetical protein I4F81_012914 [Pyropia yezoensis]|uniref:Uncharacterized protein n=1 Tax=Pyropia yezoensis TaxID=2788 RepID=A0ACC3CK49_PYRYE|nr:hypothetical protein I4F81_012914 [Neopyropia yezoensis]
MRSSDVGVFPTSCVLLCLSELRDVYFHCNAIADAVDREGSDFSVLRLEDASWEAVRFWIVSHVRRVPGTEVGTSLSREQEFGPGLSRSVIVKISRRTEWLVDNRIERVYTSLWQLKRFIAVPSAPRGLDGIFLLRSGCAGFADGPGSVSGVGVDVDDVLHDDDVSRVVNVLAVSADSRLASLDGRAWQVVLALSGQQAALEDLIVFARSHFPALSSSAEQEASLVRGFPAGPAAVGELRRFAADDLGNMIASSAGQGSPAPTHPVKLHHELPADVLLRGVLEAWPDDDGYRAHCARHGVPSIAALTPFQVVVWLSAVCGLGRQPASGSKADLWRHAVLLRGVVYDVISGFDVVARSVGFSSIESMVAPYLLWHAKECEFLSLARPEDDDLFAPVSQGGNLWHAAGPVRRSSAAVAADVLSRTPAANKQLRVVAHLLHLHLYWCTRVDRLDGEPALVDLLTVARKRPSRASTTTTDEDGDASSDVVVRVPSDPGRSSQSRKGKEPVRVDRRRKPLSGRMSVADYRPPRWSGDLTEVPHVLKSVLAGLSAFKRVPVTSGGALKVGIGPSGSLRSRLCARGAMRASGVDAELAAGSRRGLAGGSAGTGVFAARRFPAGVVVAPFFGAIIYTDLGVKLNRTVRYASSVLGSYGPTAQECSERALAVSVRKSSASEGRRVHVTETDNCSEDFTVWIVPSVCCVAGYVNDCTAVSKVDQAAAASSSHAIPRAHANVVIQVSPKVSGDDLTIDDLLAVDAVQLVACRDISPGEELVAWYGTEYDFLHDEEVRGGRASGGRLVSRSTPHTFAGV